MKAKIEIELQQATYDMLEKMAKALKLKGAEELLRQELEGSIDNIELWLDRYHILQTYHPSLFLIVLQPRIEEISVIRKSH